MRRSKTKTPKKVSAQIKSRVKKEKKKPKEFSLWTPPKGTDKYLLSTGSTLVDQAISGLRFKGGGIPFGILMEIFGQSGKGKTVMLLEMAYHVQRMGGDFLFQDPEGRVNKEFAKVFGIKLRDNQLTMPSTINEAFQNIRRFDFKGNGPYAVFTDSLSALLSSMESDDDNDKMGMRRAKEFSEQTRKICRYITENDLLVACTNQVRQNVNKKGLYDKAYNTSGGEAIKFYSSLRLELKPPSKEGKIRSTKTIKGVEHKLITGINTDVYVEKSTVAAPHKTGQLSILFDYGIDDITTNLKWLKRNMKSTTYIIGDDSLGKDIKKAVRTVENENMEKQLRKEVIKLWLEIQKSLMPQRKRKNR